MTAVSLIVPASGTQTFDAACGSWATEADLPSAASTLPSATLHTALQAAADVLFQLSGRQYPGVCSDAVRPCAKSVWTDHGRPIRQGVWPFGAGVGYLSGPWQGAASAWGWCLCNRTERAGCHTVPEVPLPGVPVLSADVVKLDGVTLTAGVDYRIDDQRYLVRLPDPTTGERRGWGCCQDVLLPDTEPGTFSVEYTFGRPPPQSGVLACAWLAYQLALSVTPAAAGECKLPQRVTSITRQGISAVVLDPMAFLDKGRTGLYLVDAFLIAENPYGLRRAASAWHPDMGRRSVRRVGT